MVTREWSKANSAKLDFAFVSAFRDDSSFVMKPPLDPWNKKSICCEPQLATKIFGFKGLTRIDREAKVKGNRKPKS